MTAKSKTFGQTEMNACLTKRLFTEKVKFLNDEPLRTIDVSLVDGNVAKKVRRIVEKRASQHYFRQHRKSFRNGGNRSRHMMSRALSYELYTLGQREDTLYREDSSHWKRTYDLYTGQWVLKKKHAFRTLFEANKAAEEWRTKYPEDSLNISPYYCKYCHQYHLGHDRVIQNLA